MSDFRKDKAMASVDGLRLIRDKMQRSAKDNTLIVGLTPEEVRYIINNSIMCILLKETDRIVNSVKEEKNGD